MVGERFSLGIDLGMYYCVKTLTRLRGHGKLCMLHSSSLIELA